MRFSPSCPGFDSWHSRRFHSFDVAKINPLLRQWTVLKLDNVGRTYLLALVLKNINKGQLKILFVFLGASATSAGKFYPNSFSTMQSLSRKWASELSTHKVNFRSLGPPACCSKCEYQLGYHQLSKNCSISRKHNIMKPVVEIRVSALSSQHLPFQGRHYVLSSKMQMIRGKVLTKPCLI